MFQAVDNKISKKKKNVYLDRNLKFLHHKFQKLFEHRSRRNFSKNNPYPESI